MNVTDPVYRPAENPGWFERTVRAAIIDPRDYPFVKLAATASLVLIPFALVIYLAPFRWWLALAYGLVNGLVFFDRYILMLHNTSHRVLFKPGYRVLNLYIPWVLGPLFGQSPETYFAHHLGMHHQENNLDEDLSSTMKFRRDRFDHFLRYFLRFFWLGIFELPAYLKRKGRGRMARWTVVGELAFVVPVAALLFVDPLATLVVFVAPFLIARFLMMAGNWGQHAFVDADSPESFYRNSITCINTRYNRRCFNDGYHIGHHVKANRHWTEMPGDLLANVDTYARERALVFDGLDFFMVWLLLMLRRYDTLARRVVPLPGGPQTHAETVALLRDRTRAIGAAA